jgi:hypothetical protein
MTAYPEVTRFFEVQGGFEAKIRQKGRVADNPTGTRNSHPHRAWKRDSACYRKLTVKRMGWSAAFSPHWPD